MKKRFLALVMTAALLLYGLSVPAQAADALPDSITLYAMNEGFQKHLTIPSGFPQSYSLAGHSVRILSGKSVQVDGAKNVTPAGETWYYHQMDSGKWVGSSGPSGLPGEYSQYEYIYGDSVLLVDNSKQVTVHTVNYAVYYAEKRMDDYLAEQVRPGMTQYEIAELCCRFVAQFDYSTKASDSTSMIVTGGGDCWASTEALLYMLQKQGISSSSHNAANEPGAGIQHINVIAQLDGSYYILEAGYNEPAPRHYTMEKQETTSSFTYQRVNTADGSGVYVTGLTIEGNTTHLVIPEQIDGSPVIGIGDGAFRSNDKLVSVTLPDTVTYLGDNAFYQNFSLTSIQLPEGLKTIGDDCFTWAESLTEITIPASVTKIDGNAFCYCKNLTSIQVAPGNPNYASRDGVLFDKAMKTLLIFPEGKGEFHPDSIPSVREFLQGMTKTYTIPNGVETVDAWSFAGVSLAEVVFPSTLKEIASRSFNNASIGKVVLPNGITTIPSLAFRDANLKTVLLPASLRTIEAGAFYLAGGMDPITIPSQVESIGALAFGGCLKSYIRVPASVKEIGANAFDFQYGWASLDASHPVGQNSTRDVGAVFFDQNCRPASIGENAFGKEMLCVYPGSYMNEYAQQHGLSWYPLNSSGAVDVKPEWFTGASFCLYTGKPVTPNLLWKTTDGTCPFSMHDGAFQITYSDNVNPGTCSVSLVGKDFLSGSLNTSFDILKSSGLGQSEKPSGTEQPGGNGKFVDVLESDYFAQPVAWAVERGITSGTSADHFSPNQTCTKAQILTFLWSASGKPEPSIKNSFIDVRESHYYCKAALWAKEKGIITGDRFSASTDCTRSMTVLYIWKSLGSPAASSAAGFQDVNPYAAYANAVSWAVEKGVTSGTGSNTFSPGNTCTRGQIVTFLYKAMGSAA